MLDIHKLTKHMNNQEIQNYQMDDMLEFALNKMLYFEDFHIILSIDQLDTTLPKYQNDSRYRDEVNQHIQDSIKFISNKGTRLIRYIIMYLGHKGMPKNEIIYSKHPTTPKLLNRVQGYVLPLTYRYLKDLYFALYNSDKVQPSLNELLTLINGVVKAMQSEYSINLPIFPFTV